jgi:hypothetical protein
VYGVHINIVFLELMQYEWYLFGDLISKFDQDRTISSVATDSSSAPVAGSTTWAKRNTTCGRLHLCLAWCPRKSRKQAQRRVDVVEVEWMRSERYPWIGFDTQIVRKKV